MKITVGKNETLCFDPWVGDQYINGIDRNKVMVVGIRHWCNPSARNCSISDPKRCLNDRDTTCTIWNKDRYQKDKGIGWQHTDDNTMQKCPLYEKCKPEVDAEIEKNGDEEGKSGCILGNFRFLHCETKISVDDYVHDRGIAQRTKIFDDTIKALKCLFPRATKPNKEYWNYIIFANFIQHYTNVRVNLAKELKKTPKKDKEALFSIIKTYSPDLIIILHEDQGCTDNIQSDMNSVAKLVSNRIKWIWSKNNNEDLFKNFMFYDNDDLSESLHISSCAFSLLVRKNSNWWNKKKELLSDKHEFLDAFITEYLEQEKNYMSRSPKNWKKKIEILTRFTVNEYGKGQLEDIRNKIVEKCTIKIPEGYKNDEGNLNHDKFKDLYRKNREMYDDELEDMKIVYSEFISSKIQMLNNKDINEC